MENIMKENEWKLGFIIVLIVLFFSIFITLALIYGGGKNSIKSLQKENEFLKEERNYAIQYGAEQVVLVLELGASCQALSNLTTEEIENYWIENYLSPKLNGNTKQS